MRLRIGAVLACAAALMASACGEVDGVKVQPLPPLQRPSPEMRAGLPEVRGIWHFAGFEIDAADTAAVRDNVYPMVPPGEFRVLTQRLDSLAGQYVYDNAVYPFWGEVRRDSAISVVTFGDGVGRFAAGRVVRDTFWLELTSFTTAQTWPQGTRVAMVRRPGGPPFRRLLGGAPITPPVDSVALRDSIRLDSLRRAGAIVPPPTAGQPRRQPLPGQPLPGQAPAPPVIVPSTPGAQRPPAQAPPRVQPRPQAPRPQPQRPPPTEPPAIEPFPETPEPPPSIPNPNAPRDTIRFGNPR